VNGQGYSVETTRIRECISCHEVLFIHAKQKCNTCYTVERKREIRLAKVGSCPKCNETHKKVPPNKLNWCARCYGPYSRTNAYKKLHPTTTQVTCIGCGRLRAHKCKQRCSSCYSTYNANRNPRVRARINAYASHYNKTRYGRVVKAQPKWVDKAALISIYERCPKGYHVDHIIPIKGTNVSGLHVPWNLQYLPAEENIRKGNRY
jgi:protein-arginine kinase activator protein McsA